MRSESPHGREKYCCSTQESVTRLLTDWSNGNPKALDKLIPLVYSELRRLAGNYLRRNAAARISKDSQSPASSLKRICWLFTKR
jgi:hypothetical protein